MLSVLGVEANSFREMTAICISATLKTYHPQRMLYLIMTTKLDKTRLVWCVHMTALVEYPIRRFLGTPGMHVNDA